MGVAAEIERSEDQRIEAMISPRSIAIVGATPDPAKLNSRVIRFLQGSGYSGQIYPVNPKYDEVLGLKCVPHVSDIAGPVDMALIALPAKATAEAVRDAGDAGAKVALVFASGFAETGAEGRQAQKELVRIASERDLRILGPNTVGTVNAFEGVLATFSQIGNNPVSPGLLAFVTQSGAIGTVVNTLANRSGMGLGYLVHTGNEADIGFVEAMECLLGNERVRVGTGYLEGVSDGAAFCELGALALDAGKPLVIMKVGRSSTGALAAASHTGALASEDRVYDAVSRQFGVIRASNEEHMLSLADGLATIGEPQGRGIAFISQSGGAAVQMTDLAEDLGMEVPELQDETKHRLQEVLPPFASFRNPVDASMQAVVDPSLLTNGLEVILEDPNVHLGVIWLQHMDANLDEVADLLEGLSERTTKPWVVAWAATPEGAKQRLAGKVCVLSGADQALRCSAAAMSFAEARRRPAPPQLEAPSLRALAPRGEPLDSSQVAQSLREAGVPVVDCGLAGDLDEARECAEGIGYPLALKIESPGLPHKSEVGGVALNIGSNTELEASFGKMLEEVRSKAPHATLKGVLLQKMMSGYAELVVGLRRDPTFGMLVMVGIGGLFVEVLNDVSFRKAPIGKGEALRMLDDLKAGGLLDGVRGRPKVDRGELAELISRVSVFGASNADTVDEMDLNPVLATSSGLVAVDWFLSQRTQDQGD